MERDTDRWRETTTVRRRKKKRGEEDVLVGSRAIKDRGKKLPANW